MNYEHEDDPKEESKEENCGNCKFFRGRGDWGKCRLRPPVYIEKTAVYDQPGTRSEWWCGEWKPNE